MHPILFKIGTFEFYSYGLMMAIGVLVALIIADFEAKRNGWNRDQITRFCVLTFIMGLVGSRLVYVMTRMNEPNVDLWAILFNFRAGFVYYGGLILAWAFVYWFSKRKKMNVWAITDMFAYCICAGLAIGRIGCMLGGCCYGIPTQGPLGVVMVQHSHLGPVHATQMYEFVFLAIIFVPLWMRRSKKAYEGEITVWYLGLYAVFRYILEFWRGDNIRGYVIEDFMTTSQFISIPAILFAFYLHYKLKKRKA